MKNLIVKLIELKSLGAVRVKQSLEDRVHLLMKSL